MNTKKKPATKKSVAKKTLTKTPAKRTAKQALKAVKPLVEKAAIDQQSQLRMLDNLRRDKEVLLKEGRELQANTNSRITAINNELIRLDGAIAVVQMLISGHGSREEVEQAQAALDAIAPGEKGVEELVAAAQPEQN